MNGFDIRSLFILFLMLRNLLLYIVCVSFQYISINVLNISNSRSIETIEIAALQAHFVTRISLWSRWEKKTYWYIAHSVTRISVKKKQCRPPESDALCRNPGLNRGPLDLQSNALPTELFRPTRKERVISIFITNSDQGLPWYELLAVTWLIGWKNLKRISNQEFSFHLDPI